MEVLFWLLAALIAVTLLGHGNWVAVRASIRGLAWAFGPERERAVPAEMCPRCGEAWARGGGDAPCFVCGWSPIGGGGPARASLARVLSALRRRVGRYARAGLLSAD